MADVFCFLLVGGGVLKNKIDHELHTGDVQVYAIDIECNTVRRVFRSLTEYLVCKVCVDRNIVLCMGTILSYDLYQSSLRLFCITEDSRAMPIIPLGHYSWSTC